MPSPQAVVLMGVCGSGKSTIGLALAARCEGKFFDADDFHPQANIDKMKRGEPLDDDDREPWLRRLAELLGDAAEGDAPIFLACSALKARYREILRSKCADLRFVHLSGTPEVIRARLRARAGHFMPEVLIDSQFAALEETADTLRVDIDSPVETIVSQICTALELARDSGTAPLNSLP